MSESMPLTFTAIDFETATLERDSACSLGLAVVEDGEITSRHSWLIRPPRLLFDEYCMALHGITASMVCDAPSFSELWPTICDRIRGPVVGHNAIFDIEVLRHTLAACEITCPDWVYFCSKNLAQEQWPGLASYSLDSVGTHLGLEFTHHCADDDAYACAMIVVLAARQSTLKCLMQLLQQHGLRMRSINCDGVPSPEGSLKPSRRPFVGHSTKPGDLSPTNCEFDTQHALFGRAVVFTGMLQTMPRVTAWQAVIDAGGECWESVKKGVDYLVVGEQDLRLLAGHDKSSKTRKAETMRAKGHPIQIITEAEFLRLISPRGGN